jgi:hypothetical protein
MSNKMPNALPTEKFGKSMDRHHSEDNAVADIILGKQDNQR